MSDAHPILGVDPNKVTPSQFPIAAQAVQPTVAKTAPLPYEEIPATEATRYYTCRVPNHHMIRTDGKKLAFVHGTLATRDANDIVYMDQVLADRNPFVRAATEGEIKQYQMLIDPINTIKTQVTPEVEAAVQKKLSDRIAQLVGGMKISDEDKSKLMGAVSLQPELTDAEKIAGIDAPSKDSHIAMQGATAVPVKMSTADIQSSLVGSNKTPNAAASSTKS